MRLQLQEPDTGNVLSQTITDLLADRMNGEALVKQSHQA
jgi:hypothetical protein